MIKDWLPLRFLYDIRYDGQAGPFQHTLRLSGGAETSEGSKAEDSCIAEPGIGDGAAEKKDAVCDFQRRSGGHKDAVLPGKLF